MPANIRPYAAADRRQVIDLIAQLNAFENAISGDRAEDRRAAEACLDSDLGRIERDGGSLVVAIDGADVIGMMCLVLDPPQPYLRADIGRIAWVAELVIDERHRGQGVGTSLLDEAERLARSFGIRRLMIGAIVGNTIARKAYERFGFKPAVLELSKDI